MTKKQIKTRNRILTALILFAILLIADHAGAFSSLPWFVRLILFVIPYLIVGYDILLRAVKNIRNGQVFDENFLMSIATIAAFIMGEYPEASAVMLFYQIGELFQSVAVGKSRQSITAMMEIAPESAFLETEDGIEEVDPEDVAPGSVLVIKPGEKIPIDGIVIEGESFLNTAALTGESVPRRVTTGDLCISGCVNGEGTLRIRTEKAYEDSTVARILDLVENASDKKARLENFITRFARVYTPVVTIGALLLAVLPPLMTGGSFKEWILRACTFLIVSCPCALVISVPLGFFGGVGAASKIGVMVKGSNYLEAVAGISTVVMDKTGTLTKGTFTVRKVHGNNDDSEEAKEKLLQMASAAERFSSHPIAQAILAACDKGALGIRAEDTKEVSGQGVKTLYEGKELLCGNETLLREAGIDASVYDAQGTLVHVAYDGAYAGTIVIADTIKENAPFAVNAMKEAGVHQTVMLSGDREAAAKEVAARCGIDEVRAELLPEEKVKALEEIMHHQEPSNAVAYIGDGVNDAPVLMRADVGIAMGSMGSDAAIEAADIVIMDDDLTKVAKLIRIAKKTMSVVKQNIVFAIGVKVLILILGALGIANLWLAVFADVGVAVIAILNSMRMLRS